MAGQISADPGEVIEQMAKQLGEAAKNLAIAQVVIANQERELGNLRAQAAAASTD